MENQLTIITVSSRPRNIYHLYENICSQKQEWGFALCWKIIFDLENTSEIPHNILSLLETNKDWIDFKCIKHPINKNSGGNYGKDLLIKEIKQGWIYQLDDDNLLYPNFFKKIYKHILKHPLVNLFCFWQKLRYSPKNKNDLKCGIVDTAMYFFKKEIAENIDYPYFYGGDGVFLEKLIESPNTNLFIIKQDLCFYNFLKEKNRIQLETERSKIHKLKKCIIFTIAQGKNYEYMASVLFKSLKNLHPYIETACLAYSQPKYCDYFFNISTLCPISNDINELHINNQAYSFKLGAFTKIPEDFLSKYEKVIFFDADSFCINKIDIDDIIYQKPFYVPWEQSIVTENQETKSLINKNWIWRGASFEEHAKFAKLHDIKEWKNVNAGLLVFSVNKLKYLVELYRYLTHRIYDFYGQNHGTEELTFSLMMAYLDKNYNTPDICSNNLSQLCMENNQLINILKNNSFHHRPWFNSSNKEFINVKFPNCVHFPNEKLFLISRGKTLYV